MDRYEEAMNRMLQWEEEHPGGYDIDAMKSFVFPELKESEDERIRKEIVDFICWAIDRGSITKEQREMSDSWFAYLEKQKDAIGAARQQGYEEGLEDGIKMNMAEQIGESKEWADELSAEIDQISKRYPEVSFAKLSRIAVHFARWQKEQKPTNSEKPNEWSEEDEKKLKAVISLMKSNRAVDPFYDKMCLEGWLKSLRPQPHWKPSEEQIAALKVVARGFPAEDLDAIDSLLTDLLKLL